jgi:hypothetical protein
VAVVEGFETNVLAGQHTTFCFHGCQYAMSGWATAMEVATSRSAETSP